MSENRYAAHEQTAPGGDRNIAKSGTISNTLAQACPLSGSMQTRRKSGGIHELGLASEDKA